MDWSVNIDAEEIHGYPSMDDLKGLLNDLNQYYDLFCLEERQNEMDRYNMVINLLKIT